MIPQIAKRVRYEAEYRLLQAGLAVFGAAPTGLAARIAVAFADAAFFALRGRRRTAVDNIVRSSLGCGREAAVRVARDSFRHFALAGVECLRMQPLFAGDAWRGRVRIAEEAAVQAAAESPNGLILACGHFGNWEVAAQVFARYRPLVVMARPMDNAKVDRILVERRFHGRVRNIPKHDANPLRMVEILRRGEALAVMIDQNAGRNGIVVDFLGRPASTYASAPLLALVTGVPIYFGYCFRSGPLAYEAGLLGPVEWRRSGRRDADVRAILAQLHAPLEALIRGHPEQYLWGHRRWRFR